MDTEPASGRTRPAMILKVVLFPAPLGPSSPSTSPSPTSNETSSTARAAPKRLVTPAIWSNGDDTRLSSMPQTTTAHHGEIFPTGDRSIPVSIRHHRSMDEHRGHADADCRQTTTT
jgi:hypothetical protein